MTDVGDVSYDSDAVYIKISARQARQNAGSTKLEDLKTYDALAPAAAASGSAAAGSAPAPGAAAAEPVDETAAAALATGLQLQKTLIDRRSNTLQVCAKAAQWRCLCTPG
jgi:hypothetical protein